MLWTAPSFRAVSKNRSDCCLSVAFGFFCCFGLTPAFAIRSLCYEASYRCLSERGECALHRRRQAHAVAIAEIEFAKIAVQMLLAAMLIDALHAALEDRKVAFDGVGVDGRVAATSA